MNWTNPVRIVTYRNLIRRCSQLPQGVEKIPAMENLYKILAFRILVEI
jgi:hypothetical protein